VECHEGLGERGRIPGGEVEDEEPQAAHHVLDVVPEDPEKQHVSKDVEPGRVQEHAREDPFRPGEVADSQAGARPADGARIERVAVDSRPARRELPEPDGKIGCDQPIGDDGEAPGRDVVEQREDLSLPEEVAQPG